MTEQSPAGTEKGSRAVRLIGAALAIVTIIGLPQRLFWEREFQGVGLLAFFLGMLMGVAAFKWLRSEGVRLGACAVLLCAGILGYWLYIGLVDRPAPANYAFSWHQLLEFSVYAFVYACWGIVTELAARITTLWRQ
jgi:hypothetical protein